MNENIRHDHVYLTSFPKESQTTNRKIRKKDDILTDEDRKEYDRRRSLNNASCRVSRLHRRSKLNSMNEKCQEYEDRNRNLQVQCLILDQVIEDLKEHLRNVVAKTSNKEDI